MIENEVRTYRTSNLNPIFGLIHSFTESKYDSNKKRTSTNTSPSYVVDNSFEISNISLTPRELIDIHHIMTLITKGST
ncbi:hypothetical protein N9738_02375 [Flavobacteriaceae bacterium]|nr:hypothetical protein [Flavobacteriaceae bacterium]